MKQDNILNVFKQIILKHNEFTVLENYLSPLHLQFIETNKGQD